ncbi:MAG: carboxymuconolactone decarboxylase family protein [Candidatus Aminicenantes bacterium]|nr:MAG: carboxymuconolactone decarboxylase family protein [Candidatus Aminicenantes bacterium]
MDKLEELTRQRKKSHTKFKEFKSKVYDKFIELEEAAYSDGAVSQKNKVLIGMGISVVKDCDACMQWHIEEAVKLGITPQEIMEAIEVGIKMGGAPAVVSARFALEVMEKVYHI